MHPRAAELIATLDLRPHPEGGYYRELFRSRSSVSPSDARGRRTAMTTIYYLIEGASGSRWHEVASDEVWHFYEGDPLELLELDASGGGLVRHRLGRVGVGRSPVRVIAAGRWQAARPLGDYCLVGCTVAPGFEFEDFRLLADDPRVANVVRRSWPDVADLL
ncbi:MAG TPA: cupin domain-containing protein [Gemmatimonadaceae bacterium]|nr:cupin domain-containing protein [Gemmatimonadaceae bacterium]